MSILIKGLQMPEKDKCIDVIIFDDGRVVCYGAEDRKIAEAVGVVRCKDCDFVNGCKNAQYLGLDGYCSHAERSE